MFLLPEINYVKTPSLTMDNSESLNDIIAAYTKNWYWFIFSVILALVFAFLHLRYAVPKFRVNAKIQVIGGDNSMSELSVLKDLNVFGGSGTTEMTDEIELLKSRDNFFKVVEKLKLNIKYEVLGKVKNYVVYPSHPFSINFLAPDTIKNKNSLTFWIKIEDENKFQISFDSQDSFETLHFGSKISTGTIGDIILIPEKSIIDSYEDKEIMVEIRPVSAVADEYRERVEVFTANEYSNSRILNIAINDAIPERGIQLLNHLIAQNNQNEIQDKKNIADRTSEFINERIAEIYGNLSSVDASAESFKEQRGIADLASQSNVNFQQSAASEQELQSANIQLNIASSMQNMLNEQDGYEIIPNVGLADVSIDNAATKYNELVAQRNRLLESSNEKNPVIVQLDQQLQSLKRGMQSSLNNVTNNLNLKVNSLSNQLSRINSRIYAAPSNQRALRDIARKQETTEGLYVYLLQKREEAQIAFASAEPRIKIVDNAFLENPFPVEPNKKIIYLGAIILGLLIPFAIIYLNELLDNKVNNMVTLQKLIGNDLVVLSEIPKTKSTTLVKKEDRSVLAESLRILRTNLDYILNTRAKSTSCKVVMLTSSVSGEGKTFLCSNLSMILATTNKRVLLLGADIRNPKIFDYFKVDNIEDKKEIPIGLTDYLHKQDLKVRQLIQSVKKNEVSLDIIYSGKILPNPSELLLSEKLEELFLHLRDQYDYVVVDSAPLLSVTDSLLLEKYTDQVIYVTKSGTTERKVLEFPLNLHRDGKLKNLSFVVNAVKESNLGYGGKYGYGYETNTKKWYQVFG